MGPLRAHPRPSVRDGSSREPGPGAAVRSVSKKARAVLAPEARPYMGTSVRRLLQVDQGLCEGLARDAEAASREAADDPRLTHVRACVRFLRPRLMCVRPRKRKVISGRVWEVRHAARSGLSLHEERARRGKSSRAVNSSIRPEAVSSSRPRCAAGLMSRWREHRSQHSSTF